MKFRIYEINEKYFIKRYCGFGQYTDVRTEEAGEATGTRLIFNSQEEAEDHIRARSFKENVPKLVAEIDTSTKQKKSYRQILYCLWENSCKR